MANNTNNIPVSGWLEAAKKELGENADPAVLVSKAITENRTDVLSSLLAGGLDINTKIRAEIGNGTPVHLAAFYGNLEAVKLLLDNGADINAKNSYRMDETPVFWAFEKDQVEIIKSLAALGADVNAKDSLGFSLIHQAVMLGKIESIKTLQELGIDVNTRNKDGDTPMFFSAMTKGDQVEIIKCLAALGADVNAKSYDGKTPIFAAVAAPVEQIARMECLKELGADLNETDDEGKTAVDLAVRYDRPEAAAWLRANGGQSMAGKFKEIIPQAELNQWIPDLNAMLNDVSATLNDMPNDDDSEKPVEKTGASETHSVPHITEAEAAILCEAIKFSK